MPLIWPHKGENRLIAGSASGRVVCVEPESGKVIWQEDNVGRNDKSTTLAGDWLPCNVAVGRRAGPRWTGRHFGTTGYSPVLMTGPIADGHPFTRGGNGIWCYDLRRPWVAVVSAPVRPIDVSDPKERSAIGLQQPEAVRRPAEYRTKCPHSVQAVRNGSGYPGKPPRPEGGDRVQPDVDGRPLATMGLQQEHDAWQTPS